MYLFRAILLTAGLALAAGDLRIRTIAGNGSLASPTAGAAAEGSPLGVGWAVAFDSKDRLYVTTVTGEVWRIDAEGKWEAVWKSSPGSLLFGLTVDSRDRVFVSDLLSHQVFRVDADGSSTVVAGNGRQGTRGDGGPATSASLDSPLGVAVDAAGNLFISDNGRIRVVNAEGLIGTHVWGIGRGALSIDRDGNLYSTDFVINALHKIAPNGSVSVAAMGTVLAVAACPDGRVHFTEFYRLRRVSEEGAEVIAGSEERIFAVDDGAARDARFVTPLALACDGRGRVVIYDASAGRLRRVEPAEDSR